MSDTSGLYSPSEIGRKLLAGQWAPGIAENAEEQIVVPSISVTVGTASISSTGSVTFGAPGSTIANLALNGIFSEKYRTYKILAVLSGDAIFQNQLVLCKMRNGTTNDSLAYYNYSTRISSPPTASTLSFSLQQQIPLSDGGSSNNILYIEIYRPNLPVVTGIKGRSLVRPNGDGNFAIYEVAATHERNEVYDGISFTFGQQISGTMQVYGVK